MKRHERDNLKNRKRGDQLQKEKDHSRTELSKNVSLREKLEKLCRELQRENNRLKVRNFAGVVALYMHKCETTPFKADIGYRARTRRYKMQKSAITRTGIISTRICFGNYRTTKKTKTILKPRL
jgi:hypothetical protein